ncbi:MAG: cobalt ECF transporter T component CbiQ [Desulfobacterales bacterium]|nr:MAG: cobalt ECF transporter T component CbiQ [Desulfobacterales bacterium]
MFEEPSHKESILLHLDPRIKRVVVFSFSIVVAILNRIPVLLCALIFALLFVLTAKVSIKELIKRLTPVNMLVGFLWLFLPFTFPGKPLFYLGSLSVTYEGVLYATKISIKSNAIMLMMIVLVATTSIFTLGHSMHALRIPQKIVHLFFFTYRYIHVMKREYVRLVNSMKIRGFKAKTNLHTYKTFAYMIGMILVRSFDRAQRVHNAMLCRGFKGNLYSLKTFSIKKRDMVSLVLVIVIIIVLGVLEWKKTI